MATIEAITEFANNFKSSDFEITGDVRYPLFTIAAYVVSMYGLRVRYNVKPICDQNFYSLF